MNASHETKEPLQPRRARTLAWAAGIAVAIVAVVAVVIFMGQSGGGSPRPDEGSSAVSAGTQSPTESVDAPEKPVAPDESEPTEVFPQLDPIAPDDVARTAGLEVQITQIEHVTGEAAGPGEVDGPAIRLSITITNEGKNPLDLSLVVINGYYGAAQTPASTFQRPGGKPFSGTLEVGKTAEGVVLLGVPEADRDDVSVTVDYRPGQPAVVFRGEY